MRPSRALAALALTLAACSPESESVPLDSFAGANLLIVSIDTLRADRLGCYGYPRGTTPNLDALAEESILFEALYANSPKTASSHMSLFTSMLPSAHKVRNQSARLGLQSPILAHNRLTISQVLARAGYWNAAVASGANVNPEMGFKRGFQGRFESVLDDVSRLVNGALKRFDQARSIGQPAFVFLHTYQVHGPYLPPKEYREEFASRPSGVIADRVAAYSDLPFRQQWANMNKSQGRHPPYWAGKEDFGAEEAAYLSDLYDAEIAYTDEHIGRLIDQLDERGILDETIVVILSDHGEEFFEHGDFEHDQLFREHLHVPCIIRLPGGAWGGTRVKGLASLIDVMPTLLEMLALEGPDTMQGQSLVEAIETGRTDDRPLVAERVMFPDDYKATMRTPTTSITFHATERALTAFDLTQDEAELSDVAGTAPWFGQAEDTFRRALGNIFALREALDTVDAGGTLTLEDQEQLEELKQMGYIDSGGGGEVPEGTPLDAWPRS